MFIYLCIRSTDQVCMSTLYVEGIVNILLYIYRYICIIYKKKTICRVQTFNGFRVTNIIDTQNDIAFVGTRQSSFHIYTLCSSLSAKVVL